MEKTPGLDPRRKAVDPRVSVGQQEVMHLDSTQFCGVSNFAPGVCGETSRLVRGQIHATRSMDSQERSTVWEEVSSAKGGIRHDGDGVQKSK